MKSALKAFATLLFATLLLVQCNKHSHDPENTVFNCHFYTSNDSSDTKLSLYIDGENKGELPFISSDLVCGDSALAGALQLSLSPGTYTVKGKDEDGHTQSSGNIMIYSDEQGIDGGTGGMSLRWDEGTCFVIRLFF